MHNPIVHSWTEQYSHWPQEGKDTFTSTTVNLSTIIKSHTKNQRNPQTRTNTHLWQAFWISLSSVGESSITIASVLSPIMEQASISLLSRLQGWIWKKAVIILLLFFKNPVNQTASICPDWAHEDQRYGLVSGAATTEQHRGCWG